MGLGGRLSIELHPRLFTFFTLFAGGYYGFFNDTVTDSEGVPFDPQQGGNFFGEAGLGISFYLTPQFSLGLSGAYRYYNGLYHGFRVSLGTSLHVSGFKRKIEIRDVNFTPIYPVLFKYYDDHTIGKAVIKNEERFPIRDIEVNLTIDQYMDKPKFCPAPETLLPGEQEEIDLYALLKPIILELEEELKASAEIEISYTLNGVPRKASTVETIRVHNRNGMSWDDDRKAAAFISAKDPEILKFSKQVAGIVRNTGPAVLNENLRMGMGMFQALSIYGMKYVIDPNTPSYVEASQNSEVVDFLQFPKQTLEYRGGDCDDLSILYCTLLESIGIETAFITIPGHIFAAFSLDIDPKEARRIFSRDDQFFIHEDTAWLPVEITQIGNPFLEAWETGAREWNDNSAKDSAKIHPVHTSWQTYEAAGAPSKVVSISLPGDEIFKESYSREVEEFIDQELYPKIQRLKTAITDSNKPMKLQNKLGVLYASYGMIIEAEKLFIQILESEEYAPAMINLGNIYYINDRYQEARDIYERADQIVPGKPAVLLNLARIHYEEQQYALVNKYYSELKAAAPKIGEKFAYLETVDDSVKRAESIENLKGYSVWEEED